MYRQKTRWFLKDKFDYSYQLYGDNSDIGEANFQLRLGHPYEVTSGCENWDAANDIETWLDFTEQLKADHVTVKAADWTSPNGISQFLNADPDQEETLFGYTLTLVNTSTDPPTARLCCTIDYLYVMLVPI